MAESERVAVSQGSLRADLRIEMDRLAECPLVTNRTANDATDVRINAVGDECTVTLRSEGGRVVTATGTVRENCFCRCFQAFDCVPNVTSVDGRTMSVRVHVEDRSTLRALIAALRDAVGRVSLDRLTGADSTGETDESTVDLSRLTAKQREALELAVGRGYFEGEVPLADLAADLDISKSALSQRLRSAEAKLVRMALRDP